TYRMAFVDELTNLPARRALTMEMMNLRGSYTVAMADVDHFKKFNDTYGHDAGDQVLRMVAARLARVGGGGKTFRYGGEEFTILFPGKEADLAIPYLERLRASVADNPFTVRGPERRRKKPKKGHKKKPSRARTKSIPVTISVGVAHRDDKHATPEAVIKAADQALYRAKKTGRNRVVS
ncbi:MAG: GGDEF domain-containing protein, partial [Pseudomonadota bacterium]